MWLENIDTVMIKLGIVWELSIHFEFMARPRVSRYDWISPHYWYRCLEPCHGKLGYSTAHFILGTMVQVLLPRGQYSKGLLSEYHPV